MIMQPFKCPVCGNRLIKSYPRTGDYILKYLYSTQSYQCSIANCWHGYLSCPESTSGKRTHRPRPCTNELKARLAVKALEGESVYFLSKKYHLDPGQISQWRWHLVNNATELFIQTPPKPQVPNEKALILHLLKQTQQLKQQLLDANKTQTSQEPTH